MKNEGYCLHCAREMHIKPVDDLMKQFGMSDEDMDAMEDRMENMMQEMGDMSSMNPFSMMMGMGQPDQSEEDGDLVPGSSATFPLGVNGGAQNGKNEKKAGKNDKKPPRRKFLDTYCENLTRKAREGKLDDIFSRPRPGDLPHHPDPEPPPEDNPCSLVRRALARPPLPRALPSALPRGRCRQGCRIRRSSCST